MKRNACLAVSIAILCLLATGCSGSSSSNTTSQATPVPATTSAAQGEMAREQMALPSGAAAPIPPKLHCTDAIVWVNLSSKTYHMSGDPYYGRTKHGEYMCEATAEGKGYHLAGMPHRHTTGMQSQPQPSPT